MIGIDLGTGFSCVACYREGAVEVVPNRRGGRTTPSTVSFTDGGVLVGEQTGDIVYESKRLMGKQYEDVDGDDVSNWPFTIVNDGGKPKYAIRGEKVTPEEIGAHVLRQLKKDSEEYLGREVDTCVLCCPAYFSDSQRQATKDAAEIAGLKVLRLINEPTAAAIAYGLDRENGTVLVYDFGSGTLDVSFLSIDDGLIEVIATAGDNHLGGTDFTNRLLHHLGLGPRFRMATERAKRELSSCTQTAVETGDGNQRILTRAEFEEVCEPLFRRAMLPVERVMADSRGKKVSTILLVGGTSRIPKVQRMLAKRFPGVPISKSINPDESVAYGAAIYGAVLTGRFHQELLLVDVCPLSLGVRVANDMVSTIIHRNTPVPVTKKEIFTTHYDNQLGVTVKVLEGESMMASKCHPLGQFTLSGILPARQGVPQVEVSFQLNLDGILSVTATDLATGKNGQVIITNRQGRLTEREIKEAADRMDRLSKLSEEAEAAAIAANNLESVIYNYRHLVNEPGATRVSEEERDFVRSKCEEYDPEGWLPGKKKEEIDGAISDLVSSCGGIMSKLR